ncbi:DUF2510 domain-containing protein [Glaciihabitans arcticus]|nr:DUF2510 domain-containing protein [Glaciihabitans arcticus]
MAPGWYPDPDGRPHQRWFNGADWTSELAPSGSNPPRLSVVGDASYAPTPAPAPAYSAAPSPMPTMLATAPPPVASQGQYGISSLPAYAPDAPVAPSYGVQTSSAFQTAPAAPPASPAYPSLAHLPGPGVAALPAADVRLALAPTPAPVLSTPVLSTPVPSAAPVAPQAHRPVVQGHSGIATPPEGTSLPQSSRPRAQRALDLATQSSALGIAYDRADYGAASPTMSTEEEISVAASRAATLAAFTQGLSNDLLAPAPAAAPPVVAPAVTAPSVSALAPTWPSAVSLLEAPVALVPAYRVPETAAFAVPTTTPALGFSGTTLSAPGLGSSYQPFAMIPEVRKGTDLKPARTYTAAAWLIALLPLLMVGVGVGIVLFYPEFYSRFAQVGIVAVATLVSFALAARDRSELIRAGHARAASAAWMILTPVGYFVARMIFTARQSKGGAWPLVLFIAVVGASVFGIMQLPEWAPALLLTPAG